MSGREKSAQSEAEASRSMDEQEQAQQELKQMFRRDMAKAAAQPPRKRRRLNTTTLVWLIAVAIIVFVLAPTAFVVIYPRFGPSDTLKAFCLDESVGDYSTAYTLLSQRARAHTSLTAFTQASKSVNLASCSVNNGVPFIFGGTRSSLDVGFNIDSATGVSGAEGSVSFVSEKGQWRVDAMTPDLFHLSS